MLQSLTEVAKSLSTKPDVAGGDCQTQDDSRQKLEQRKAARSEILNGKALCEARAFSFVAFGLVKVRANTADSGRVF